MSEVTRSVGRYDIVREIGRGGMAVVYEARQVDLDRQVALKQMAAFQGADPTLAQRFVRESRLSASLSHPNIVTVHDYFEHGGTPFIAMEYLPRGSLRPRMADLTLAQVGGLMEGLFAGLSHAEAAGIVHRDLKPENLLITGDGRIKIADFGIAKASGRLTTGQFATATGAWMGTPAYMAPEQAMADEVGPQTDLYSVGIMAYELLCGQVPFSDTDAPMARLLRHINEPVPPAREVSPGVDPELSDWVESLLRKAPGDRPRNASEAWDGLEEIILRLLGPRWRREAGLQARPAVAEAPPPLARGRFERAAEPREARAREREAPKAPPPAAPPPMPVRAEPPAAPAAPPPAAPPPATPSRAGTPRLEPGAAEAPRPRAPSGRRPAALAAVAAAALVAAVAGFLIAHGGADSGDDSSLPNSVADALNSVSYPGDWSRRDAAPALEGLSFTDTPEPIALGPRDRPSAGLVVGRTGATGPKLLPRSLLSRLPAPPRPQAVELSGTGAYRYAGLRPRGSDGSLTVFVIPTTAGVVTAACYGPGSLPPQVTRTCERAAGTLEVLGAEPFPLGPNAEYAKTISGALASLSDDRRAGLGRLNAAGTQQEQARAAQALGQSYARAARSLGLPASSLSPADRPANEAIVAALRRASQAYGQMSTAAAGDSATSYDAARAAVGPAERAVSRAVARLGAAGYEVS